MIILFIMLQEELRTQLDKLKEKLQKHEETKLSYDEIAEHIKVKMTSGHTKNYMCNRVISSALCC